MTARPHGASSVAHSSAGRREWLGLAVLTLPVLLVSMDMTVLHLAIPQITEDLRPTGPQMLWIVDIYGFTVAGLLITMGTLGDRIGRRRLLMIGAAAFAIASLASAFSTNPLMLIGARAALGVAGATLAPSTLALIRTIFVDPSQRARATSVWVLAFMVGASIGPVVGGVLLQQFWWGSVFLLGVPVMLVLLATGPALLPEYRPADRPVLDLPSTTTSLAAVLAAVYGLKALASGAAGWLPWSSLVLGVLLGLAFARRQRKLAYPLMDFELFGDRLFTVAIGVLTLGSFVLAGVGLLTAQYLQLVLGLSPLVAGMWILPPLVAGIAAVATAQAVGARLSLAFTTCGGLIVTAVGLVLLSRLSTDSLATVVLGLALVFVGLMPVLARGVDTVTGAAPVERAGAASALSETTQELGSALGIATLGSITAAVYRTEIAGALDGRVPEWIQAEADETLAGALLHSDVLPSEVLPVALDAFTGGAGLAAGITAFAAVIVAVAAAMILGHESGDSAATVATATDETPEAAGRASDGIGRD